MTLKQAAWLVVAMHVLGALVAAIVMSRGIAPTPLDERMRFLASPFGSATWHLSWLVWALAGLSIVIFAVFLVEHVGPRARRMALLLVAGAFGVDVLCDSLQACLSELARAGDVRGFLLVERLANVGGLVAANGLYSLAIAAVTPFLPERRTRLLGSGVVVAGAAIVVGGVVGDARVMPYVVAVLILFLCAWVLDTARVLEAR